MSVAPSDLDGRVAPPELGLWGVLVVVAAGVPGLGLAVGLVLAATRLREHRTARVVIPVLGAVATLFWAAGLWSGLFDGSGVGPVSEA